MADKLETLNNMKEKIKEKFNISDSRKVKKFLGVYYKWGRDKKVTYEKMTMDKDVNNLEEKYEKYTVSGVNVQKNPGALRMTLSKSDLDKSYNIYKYRSFVGQLM